MPGVGTIYLVYLKDNKVVQSRLILENLDRSDYN